MSNVQHNSGGWSHEEWSRIQDGAQVTNWSFRTVHMTEFAPEDKSARGPLDIFQHVMDCALVIITAALLATFATIAVLVMLP